MIWKEFSHIRNDKMTIRLMVFPVLIQILVLGYALTTEVKNTPLTVLDQSNTPQSLSLIRHLSQSDLFVFKGNVNSRDEARRALDRGEARLALIIPPDFSTKLNSSDGAFVQLLVDGQDVNSSVIAAGYANSIIFNWSMDHLKQQLAKQGIRISQIIPIAVTPQILFNPLLKSTWYMIPGLVVFLVTIVTGLLTGFSIVKEKERGTLEQLLVTPIAPIHIIAGKSIPFMIIGVLEICVFLVLATFWFGVPFRGNPLTLILFGVIYMFSSLGIGIFTSTIARSAQQVLFMIWFILIFFLLLSGFFVPVENMPGWVQKITLINPIRYFMFISRDIFLKGSGIAELWREGVAMLLIGTVMLGLSLAVFKRKVG